MPDNEAYLLVATSRTPWNKGKLIRASAAAETRLGD